MHFCINLVSALALKNSTFVPFLTSPTCRKKKKALQEENSLLKAV